MERLYLFNGNSREENNSFTAQAGTVDNVIPSFPWTIPFPANTPYVCERGREGCNALIYQLMTEGRGKVEEGREQERGRREEERVERLGWEERGRRKRRGITRGGGVSGTQERRRNEGDDMKGGDYGMGGDDTQGNMG